MFKYDGCLSFIMSETRNSLLEDFVNMTVEDLGDYEVNPGINFVNGYALRFRSVHVPVQQIRDILDRLVRDHRIMTLYPEGITKETAHLSDTYYKRVLLPL